MLKKLRLNIGNFFSSASAAEIMAQPTLNPPSNDVAEKYRTIFKDRYDFEFGLREKLNSSIAVFLGILGVTAGGILSLAQGFDSDATPWTFAFWSFLALGTVFFALAMLLTDKAFRKLSYSHLAEPRELYDYYKGLEKCSLDENAWNAEIDSDLLERYVKGAQINHALNERRIRYLLRTKSFIAAAIIFIFIAGAISSLKKQKATDHVKELISVIERLPYAGRTKEAADHSAEAR